ncbi:MAG: flavin reductase family protein [Kiritimatiellae bacterium]|nr:flavin reductase family protein [Kiritimatiellia bacterium]
MKKKIEMLDYAATILKAVKKGVLLTTKANGKVNTMSISWGALGIEWNKPIFTTYVREGRYTRELLDANGEFTVNVPMDGSDLSLIGKCGSVSGRDVDKIAANNLTLVEGEAVSVPAIKEYPLTLECRVTYKQLQDDNAIAPEDIAKFYKPGYGGTHIAYFGEIVAAYIIEK